MKTSKKTFKLLLASSLALSFSGCGGEFSYKRGSSIADFQASKTSCASKEITEKEIDHCLAENGWLIVDMNKPLSPLPMSVSKGTEPSTEEAQTLDTSDPLTQLTIGAWFKLGASQNQLITDSEQCVAELGEVHQTQKNLSLVTRGLLSCMSELGWHGLVQ